MNGTSSPALARWLPVGILVGVVLVAVVALVAARAGGPTRLSVDLGALRNVPAENEPESASLRVAVGAMLTPETSLEAYRSLIRLLGANTGRPAEMVQRSSYEAVNELLGNGHVDVAFVCSGAYADLRRRGRAELLVVPEVRGDVSYRSLILARRGVPAASFADLRGRSFAFTDPMSHTGYTYPTWRLVQLGESPETFFAATTFTRSHEKAIRLVADGLVDAAAVDSLVYDGLCRREPAMESRLRVVEASPSFGIPPVVTTRSIDAGLRRRLMAVLLSMHRDPAGALALRELGFDRFVRGEEARYDEVERMRRDVDAARSAAP